jgi:excisionase family DNA binding protein
MSINSGEKARVETEYHENKLPARLLPVGEVASFLGVHSNTIRRWEEKGLLKSYAIGPHHNLRFKQEDVLIFLAKCQKKGYTRASANSGLDTAGRTVRSERGVS